MVEDNAQILHLSQCMSKDRDCMLGLLSLPNGNPGAPRGHSEGPADHLPPSPLFMPFQSALWPSMKLSVCLGPLSWAQGVSQESEAGFWPKRKPHPFSWCACVHPQFEPRCPKILYVEVMVPSIYREVLRLLGSCWSGLGWMLKGTSDKQSSQDSAWRGVR